MEMGEVGLGEQDGDFNFGDTVLRLDLQIY